MRNAGLDEAQAEIKVAGRNINNLRYADGTAVMEESYDKPRQHIKKQRHYFANKDPSSQSYGFFSTLMDVRVEP